MQIESEFSSELVLAAGFQQLTFQGSMVNIVILRTEE